MKMEETIIDFLEWMNDMATKEPMMFETDNEDIALMYIAYKEHQSKVNNVVLDDVSESVCDCTHQQACKICGAKKGLDGDFWDIIAK